MSLPSPLTGLAELIKSLAASFENVRIPDLRGWAETRLTQAMRCPECGHGGELSAELREEQAAGCDCSDTLCACNPENVVDTGDAW